MTFRFTLKSNQTFEVMMDTPKFNPYLLTQKEVRCLLSTTQSYSQHVPMCRLLSVVTYILLNIPPFVKQFRGRTRGVIVERGNYKDKG